MQRTLAAIQHKTQVLIVKQQLAVDSGTFLFDKHSALFLNVSNKKPASVGSIAHDDFLFEHKPDVTFRRPFALPPTTEKYEVSDRTARRNFSKRFMHRYQSSGLSTINEHIRNMVKESEMESEVTIRNFLTVQTEGQQYVNRDAQHKKRYCHIKPVFPSLPNVNGIELSTICRQLKLTSTDGKKYNTDCANVQNLLRII